MYLVAGFLLCSLGILLPSSALVEFFRPLPSDPVLRNQLLLGALFFRIGLIVLGIFSLILHRSRWLEGIRWARHDPGSKYWKYGLWSLLIISLALRLYKLNEGLWLDEVATYIKHLSLPLGEMVTTYKTENQHFLFTILAHISSGLFGKTAWAMRLPAVLFGLGSLAALYRLGTEVSDRREAMLASILLSFSYYHIWFSQNARGYTGLLFWTLLSSLFLIRAFKQSHPLDWMCYGLSAALGIYTQFVMVFVVASHFLIYIPWVIKAETLKRKQSFLLGFVFAGLITFQLYSLVLPQFFGLVGEQKPTDPQWKNPAWTLIEFMKGMRVSFKHSFAAIGALAIFAAGLASYLRSRPVVIVLFLLPAILGASVIVLMGHSLWPRFFFFTFGFGALIAIRGTTTIAKKIFAQKWKLAANIFSIAMITASAISISSVYRPKQDFMGAMQFVNANRVSGDSVVTIGRLSKVYILYFGTDWTEVTTLQTLQQMQAHSKRTWMLYMIPRDVEAVYPEIWKHIERNFKVIKKFPSPLSDGAIYVLRWDGPA